jgi:hypothetical protein
VRLVFRLGLLGQPDDLVDLLRRDLRLTPPAETATETRSAISNV